MLRAALNPQMVSVIPNAVVASQFKPDPGAQDPNFSKPIRTKFLKASTNFAQFNQVIFNCN